MLLMQTFPLMATINTDYKIRTVIKQLLIVMTLEL